MTINLKLDLTEDQLRRIRATYGRGGRATRNEARVWLNRVIAAASQGLPEPKVRRKAVPPSEPQHVARARTRAAAQAAPDEAVCEHCLHTKDQHGRLGYACPAPFRSTFSHNPEARPVTLAHLTETPALVAGGPNL